MYYEKKLENIYNTLDIFKSQLFCNCDLTSKDIINNIVDMLIEDRNDCEQNGCNINICYSNGILKQLLDVLCCIGHESNFDDCEYLGYIKSLKFVIQQMQTLLNSIKCCSIKSCKYIADIICILVNVMGILLDVISNIKNIELICNCNICCKNEILNCWICMLSKQVEFLEMNIDYLEEILCRASGQYYSECNYDNCDFENNDNCGCQNPNDERCNRWFR